MENINEAHMHSYSRICSISEYKASDLVKLFSLCASNIKKSKAFNKNFCCVSFTAVVISSLQYITPCSFTASHPPLQQRLGSVKTKIYTSEELLTNSRQARMLLASLCSYTAEIYTRKGKYIKCMHPLIYIFLDLTKSEFILWSPH